ncbi:endopeptidase La [Candidatus Legionella polyplacis]|uniref:Lon protease n=1 Tax=Candidatus Legionella polyplacis TaxID=2005262 RepID=A0ABZ2GWD1_9GAMM|nr:endopeptidase La [Candidatus Legionella polyplacis]ATW01835.1 endopeptidase La [Candidatus Legionella polyplacis]
MSDTKLMIKDNIYGKLLFPVLPLRDVVVYPNMVVPLFVGREKSIKALEASMIDSKQIFLVAQKESSDDDPNLEDIYSIGTISNILQLLKLPDGTVKILVEGDKRAKVIYSCKDKGYLEVELDILVEVNQFCIDDSKDILVLKRTLISQFEQYISLNKKIPLEVINVVSSIENPGKLSDTIASNLSLKVSDKQNFLEIIDVRKRLENLIAKLEVEIDLLHAEKKIRERVKKQMEKTQREYYLNEQIKAIQKELSKISDEGDEIRKLENNIKNSGMHNEAMDKSLSELYKLKMMSPVSAEATVIRNYLDWMLSIPWKKRNKIEFDLQKAESLLNEEHYGLDKIKDRIIEYLAVQKRVKNLKGPILCFVGPPGVGKTSLGRSIARAIGRTFIRFSLGGLRDEAEIRGHRKTYIGSMPGKIIQKLCKVKVKNPLMMLDEIDKMSMDFRGDPSSALLEVLDSEQNYMFNDHYLEIDYDLSEVMFIATANSLDIPVPLLDRMEIIRLPGYTDREKLFIAKKYLVPKQVNLNGLKKNELNITESAIYEIIYYYTREAGVRNLEREISSICRKVVRNLLIKNRINRITVSCFNIKKYLGVKKYTYEHIKCEVNYIGRVNGLAWTSVGGEVLIIEALMVPGKGKIIRTGQLGKVMQESIYAAMTVVRSCANFLKLERNFYDENDFHIHIPEGAIPKDGPSAGIGVCVALTSVVTKIPIRYDIAMTGEITLLGKILPIGGLKEKLLAACRFNIKDVLIPEENYKDLEDVPDNVLKKINIHTVKDIKEVLRFSLTKEI